MDDIQPARSLARCEWDEQELLVAVQRGDHAAFSEIYRRYHAYLIRFVESRGADRTLAEEVVQETFVRAFAALDRFDPARPVTPWLGTIAARVLIDSYRETGRVAALPAERVVLDRAYDSTLERVLAAEAIRMLERAIDELPSRQKRVLLASTLGERSPAELAARENISEASVVSLVYRARRSVRRTIRRLAIAIVGIRLTGRRLRDDAENAAVWMGNAQVLAGASAAWLCWSMALLLTFGADATTVAPRRHTTEVASAAAGGGTALTATGSFKGEPGAGRDRGGPPYRHPGLVITTQTGAVREHAVMPSSGGLVLEVPGPGGPMTFEVAYECDGNLSDVLPDDGPVRSGC